MLFKLKTKEEYCTTKEIAQLFGISVRRVQQLTQDGIIETVQVSRSRRYEKDATVQRYIKFLSDKAHGKSKSETVEQLKEHKLRAEIALKESQGELHRLRTEIAAGRYLSIEEIKMDYSRFFISCKNYFMGIPSRLAGRLTGVIDPVEVRKLEKDMNNEVKKLLNSFVNSAVVEGRNSGNEKTRN